MKRTILLMVAITFAFGAVFGACSPAVEETPPDYEGAQERSKKSFRELKKEERKEHR